MCFKSQKKSVKHIVGKVYLGIWLNEQWANSHKREVAIQMISHSFLKTKNVTNVAKTGKWLSECHCAFLVVLNDVESWSFVVASVKKINVHL